jgi:hypothetical protein
MPSANGEWLKILISAVSGLFAGLIADPIRGVIQVRVNTIRMESAIQFDFINLSISMKAVEEGLVPAWKFWLGVELPAFEYYWNKNRELFYGSVESQLLRLQCMTVERLKGLVANKQKTGEEAMEKLHEVVAKVTGMQKPLTWKRRIIFKLVR